MQGCAQRPRLPRLQPRPQRRGLHCTLLSAFSPCSNVSVMRWVLGFRRRRVALGQVRGLGSNHALWGGLLQIRANEKLYGNFQVDFRGYLLVRTCKVIASVTQLSPTVLAHKKHCAADNSDSTVPKTAKSIMGRQKHLPDSQAPSPFYNPETLVLHCSLPIASQPKADAPPSLAPGRPRQIHCSDLAKIPCSLLELLIELLRTGWGCGRRTAANPSQ